MLTIILLVLISPIILVTCYVFSAFPVLLNLNKIFYSLDNINDLFFDAFLYIYVTFRFVHNVSVYIFLNRRGVSKYLSKILTSYVFLSQICLILNLFIQYFLLIICGDIETNPGPSNDAKSLSICHWNLNGISTQNFIKLSMLEAYNALHNYDIICISETYLNSSLSDNDLTLKLQGYELIRSDHPSNTKRGGVCIYYKDHLPLKIRRNISALSECLVVELKTKKHKCFISCIYRSPSQSSDEFEVFCEDVESTLSNLNHETPLCSIVLGDFNAKNKKWLVTDNNNRPGVELDRLFSIKQGLPN